MQTTLIVSFKLSIDSRKRGLMKLNIGETVENLPEKNGVFGTGMATLLVRRGWDVLMENNPNRWVVLDQQDNAKSKKGGAFWTRAKNYNTKYYTNGYQFAVRNIEGTVTFFGRYTPELKIKKES